MPEYPVTYYPEYVQRAIDRLQTFEPDDGFFVAFSGGKDSQCVYHLCELAGVKFDAHYSVTSVDPPELVRFIREKYPGVSVEIPHDRDGNPVTMWNLIPKKCMPPTRLVRYCCTKMKECEGRGRVTVTGVRWAESLSRKETQDVVSIPSKSKRLQTRFDEAGAEYRVNKSGGIVLNDDNDVNRRMVEQCYRTHKTLVNPIVDWTDDQVWHFLKNVVRVESCSLYADGFTRLGCIGCPLASAGHRRREFERWPKYKELYLRTFDRMLAERARRGLPTAWKTAQEVFDWWMEIAPNVIPGKIRMDELMEVE